MKDLRRLWEEKSQPLKSEFCKTNTPSYVFFVVGWRKMRKCIVYIYFIFTLCFHVFSVSLKKYCQITSKVKKKIRIILDLNQSSVIQFTSEIFRSLISHPLCVWCVSAAFVWFLFVRVSWSQRSRCSLTRLPLSAPLIFQVAFANGLGFGILV